MRDKPETIRSYRYALSNRPFIFGTRQTSLLLSVIVVAILPKNYVINIKDGESKQELTQNQQDLSPQSKEDHKWILKI